jgi:hypothetical protein
MAKLGTWKRRVAKSRASLNATITEHGGPKAKSLKAPDRPKRSVIYVAVVARQDMSPGLAYLSDRHDDGWYALMGTDKAGLIHDALQKVQEFGADRYEVWVGTLIEKVLLPIHFEVVKL